MERLKKVFLQKAVPQNDPVPGTVITIQTFGDFLEFDSLCFIFVISGHTYGNKGMSRFATLFDPSSSV